MARPKKQVTGQQGMEGAIAIANDSSSPAETTSIPDSYGDDVQLTEVTTEPSLDPVSEVSQSEPEDTSIESSYVEPSEPIFSEEEERAMRSGWTPKSAFQGDSSKWRDAKAWNERNNVHSIIDEQKREISEMRRKQDEMLQLMQEERARNAQLQVASLEKEKEEAIRMADVDRVKHIDEIIYNLKGVVSKTPPQRQAIPEQENVTPQQIPREVEDFKARNKWFNGNDDLSIEMTAYAMSLENQLNLKRTTMNLSEKYSYIENAVIKRFNQIKNVAPVETRRSPMSDKNPNSLPRYDSLDIGIKQLIEHFAAKEEFKSRKDKKPFDKGAFRAKYVRDLIKNGVIDNTGKDVGKNRR